MVIKASFNKKNTIEKYTVFFPISFYNDKSKKSQNNFRYSVERSKKIMASDVCHFVIFNNEIQLNSGLYWVCRRQCELDSFSFTENCTVSRLLFISLDFMRNRLKLSEIFAPSNH